MATKAGRIAAALAAVLALWAPAAALAAEGDAEAGEDNTQRYTRTWTKECYEEDLAATAASFPASMRIDDGDYHGDIPLVSVTQEPVTSVHEYETNQVRVVSGLPDNDVARIPQSYPFTVDSGNVVLLDLAGISWVEEEHDEYGIPTSYTAYCNYRGVDSVEVLDRYQVTATYDGPVDGPVTGVVEEAVEVSEARQVLDVVQADAGGDDGEDGGQGGVAWPLIAALGAAGAAGAAVAGRRFLVAWWRRSRFVVTSEEGGRERTVARCRIEDFDGGSKVTVPATVDLVGGATVRGYMPRRRVDAGGRLVVAYGSAVALYDGPVAAVLELNRLVYETSAPEEGEAGGGAPARDEGQC